MLSAVSPKSTLRESPAAPAVLKVVKGLSADKVTALLFSKQFDVIYRTPFSGSDEDFINTANQCDTLVNCIDSAAVNARFKMFVQVLDSCLLPNLPAQEIRMMLKAIVDKDASLLTHMPYAQALLSRVFRGVELSDMLAPAKIQRIANDVRMFNEQFGRGGQ